MDQEAWQATVQGMERVDMTSNYTDTHLKHS